MRKIIILCVVLAILLIAGLIFFKATPLGRYIWNNYQHTLHKIDDSTTYETRKQVEDTCRAMIASWEADLLTYKQYKDSDKEEQQSWAEQAKMRANKTASEYNNYILKNSYVWNGNIPSDIYGAIENIE